MRTRRVNPLLEIALAAARAATADILAVYRGSFAVEHKQDGSPLTIADLRANQVIGEILARTEIPVISEETETPFARRATWTRFWLVDPLDGTKDFIARNDEFTVNLALVENGGPTLGVIAAPALDTVWFAARGDGAWEMKAGAQRKIDARAPWPAAPRMAVSRFHDTPASEEFARLNGIGSGVKAGSALKFARLAASEVEFYPRFAGSCEWDIAAGHALILEAGGFLRTQSGGAPAYNQPSLRNPHFVAWRPPLRWEQIQLPTKVSPLENRFSEPPPQS